MFDWVYSEYVPAKITDLNIQCPLRLMLPKQFSNRLQWNMDIQYHISMNIVPERSWRSKKKLVHQCAVFDSSLFKISESASFYEFVLLEHSSNKELRVVKV